MKRALLLLFMLLVGVGLYYWLPIEPKWSYVQDDCRTAFNPIYQTIKDGVITIVRVGGSLQHLDAIDGHDLNETLYAGVIRNENGRVKAGLWNLAESREHLQFPDFWAQNASVAISSNGRWLYTSHRGQPNGSSVLHDLHSNNAQYQLTKDYSISAFFSRDSSRLQRELDRKQDVLISNQTKREIWDVATRRLLAVHGVGRLFENDIVDDSMSLRFKKGEGPGRGFCSSHYSPAPSHV